MSGIIQPADTATRTIAGESAGIFNVGYGYYPQEGSRVVSTQYNWTAQSGFAEDLSQLQGKGIETTLQSVYVDNGSNTQPVTITVAGSGQVVTVPASSQGVFPLFISGMGSFIIVTTAAGVPTPIAATTRCYFLNMPISPAVWHV